MTLSHFIKQNNKCNTETKWYAPRIEGKCAHISLLDKYLGAKAVIDPDEAFRYRNLCKKAIKVTQPFQNC